MKRKFVDVWVCYFMGSVTTLVLLAMVTQDESYLVAAAVTFAVGYAIAVAMAL